MSTSNATMIEAVEVLAPVAGGLDRTVVELHLPLDVVKDIVTVGAIESEPCDLYGKQAVVVRIPRASVAELVCALRAADRAYGCVRR